jgi:putative transposase
MIESFGTSAPVASGVSPSSACAMASATAWLTARRGSAIRTDNGVPFTSPNALFNLSKLSVWWLRLGIDIERIKPGNPQQNGRHECMHLTLKQETTKPAGANFLQQQAKFDAFIAEFNIERPHQALGMKPPAAFYTPSKKAYEGLPELDYPLHDKSVIVTTCGRICFNTRKINLSHVFAGQRVGIKQVDDRLWLITFMDYDLGYFDDTECRLEPLDNPLALNCYPCLQNKMSPISQEGYNVYTKVPRAVILGLSG